MDDLNYPFDLPAPVYSQPPGHWKRRGASDTLIALATTPPGNKSREWTGKLRKNANIETLDKIKLVQCGLGDELGYTAWHYWAHGPQPENDFSRLIQELPRGLENRLADNGEHPAHRLLLRGADEAFVAWVEKFGLPGQNQYSGDTCWHMLAWHGGEGRVSKLSAYLDLEQLDFVDGKGLTAVIIAAHRGTREDLDQWLLLGANPDIPDRSGCTLLHHVARYGEADWYEKILDMGADDELRNDRKQKPASILEDRVRHSTPEETRAGQRRYWEIAYFHKTHM